MKWFFEAIGSFFRGLFKPRKLSKKKIEEAERDAEEELKR